MVEITQKCFGNISNNRSIPPLDLNGEIIIENGNKAACFNEAFTNITKLDSNKKYYLDFDEIEEPRNATLNWDHWK